MNGSLTVHSRYLEAKNKITHFVVSKFFIVTFLDLQNKPLPAQGQFLLDCKIAPAELVH